MATRQATAAAQTARPVVTKPCQQGRRLITRTAPPSSSADDVRCNADDDDLDGAADRTESAAAAPEDSLAIYRPPSIDEAIDAGLRDDIARGDAGEPDAAVRVPPCLTRPVAKTCYGLMM